MMEILSGKVESRKGDRTIAYIGLDNFLDIFTRNFTRKKNSIYSVDQIEVPDYKRLAFLENPIPANKKIVKIANSGTDDILRIECNSKRLWFFEIAYGGLRNPDVVELTSSDISIIRPSCTFTMALINMDGLRNVWLNPHPKGWDDVSKEESKTEISESSDNWYHEAEIKLQHEFAGEFGAEEPCNIKKPTILFKLIPGCAKKGVLPVKSRKGDTGYDLFVLFDRAIPPGRTIDIPTGFEVKIPDGYWGSIKARSSTLLRRGLMVMEGVIDQNYTGKLSVLVYNPGNAPIIVEQGERLAQLILIPLVDCDIMESKELPKTNRGKAAFGSSGK